MPRPGEDPSLDDDGLAVRVDDQLREVMAYNNGFLLESSGDEEEDDEAEDDEAEDDEAEDDEAEDDEEEKEDQKEDDLEDDDEEEKEEPSLARKQVSGQGDRGTLAPLTEGHAKEKDDVDEAKGEVNDAEDEGISARDATTERSLERCSID